VALLKCYKCQKFGHVWVNCRQPPRCLWCGGSQLQKECPEKGKKTSTPACCNCKLADEEETHPSNYRGCSHETDEMRKKKSQRAPKATTGRVFFSTYHARSVRGGSKKQREATEAASYKPGSSGSSSQSGTTEVPATLQHHQQQGTGQSVRAPNVNSLPLENMLRLPTIVQQIMTS
jgi:hypothetical protein